MSAFRALNDWDKQLAQQVAEHLNKQGVVSDEDDYGLPSVWIEAWSDECTLYLRSLGYNGGKLNEVGKYINGYGAIYGLYDQDQLNYDQAMAYIVNLANLKM